MSPTQRTLTFTVPGQPVPKGRPRFVSTGTGTCRAYTPKRTKDYEALVKQYALVARQAARWRLLESEDVVLIVRPFQKGGRYSDPDNVFKSVADALQGVIYANDVQIIEARAHRAKRDDDNPRTEIEVREA